jgi:hypothetical protein
MLDFSLLLVAGICNFALGYLGFRLTTRRIKQTQKPYYERVFIIIGAIGWRPLCGAAIGHLMCKWE